MRTWNRKQEKKLKRKGRTMNQLKSTKNKNNNKNNLIIETMVILKNTLQAPQKKGVFGR